ncbi:MAG: S-layer homology domain-containing protein [Chloroflexi bacterium]|nr:S-layer homology domain-containing protein [Chloroflexota bacterium]
MNKTFTVILLLTMFMTVQFGAVSAAPVSGTVTVVSLPTFHSDSPITLNFDIVNMNAGTKYISIWSRLQSTPAGFWSSYCEGWDGGTTTAASVSNAVHVWDTLFYWDQDVVEFYITVNSAGACLPGDVPPTTSTAMASTFIDWFYPDFIIANPPSLESTWFDNLSVACNTFELWGIASDGAWNQQQVNPQGYSGFEGWHPNSFGVFAPPAPLGTTYDLLSWVNTIPSTATGNWRFWVEPSDFAGNQWPPIYFRWHDIDTGSKWANERAECANYPDVSDNTYEIYIRYMAQLELGHGYLDGTFQPDGTLTRAEMAAFIELANGYTGETIPTQPPSPACTFSDVTESDWFAGWVWQACADTFMIGVSNGMFDPNNTLTRGQVVTVLDNINSFPLPPRGGYLGAPESIYNDAWGILFREAVWLDVNIGDYFVNGVINAYGVGVADETSANMFSPNQPITRGEFMKMMYRALSRIQLECECKVDAGRDCCD